MSNKLFLSGLLIGALLVACDSGHAPRDPGPLPLPLAGPPSAPPPGPASWTTVTYHYLGPLWGSSAGPFQIGYFPYGCDAPNGVGIQDVGSTGEIEGICFDAVTIDGMPTLDGNALRTGQIIELYKSSISRAGVHGFGAWIDIRRTVVGSVEAVDAEHLRMTVLGQQVHVTDQTMGEPNSLTGDAFDFVNVAIGDHVSVSGHFSGGGEVMATLIERTDDSGPRVLRGILSQEANGLFGIGEQVVDLSSAVLEGFPGGTPVAGDTVLLFADQDPQAGVLTVQSARYDGGLWDPLWDPIGAELYEFDGFVTAANGPFDLDIEGHNFYNATAGCAACIRLSELGRKAAIGAFVTLTNKEMGKVELQLNSATWRGEYLKGPIDSIDPTSAALTVAGYPVQTNPATHISAEDSAADSYPWVGSETKPLAELSVGATVFVEGGVREVPDNILIAGSVLDSSDGVQIRTQHYQRRDPEIIYLGHSILTDANTLVLGCDSDGVCTETTPAWIFSNTDYFPPVLTIDIEPDSVPQRAAFIRAERDL